MKCICAHQMDFKVSNVKFNDEITIKNVPHFECQDYGVISYDLSLKIVKVTKKGSKRNRF